MVNFFLQIFEIEFFWLVVAIFDLKHDAEAIYGLLELVTASGNLYEI